MMALDCYLSELDAGHETRPFRTTANAVCCVVSGEGTTRVGNETIRWSPRDVFSLPRGNWIAHKAESTAQLFMCTDRDVLRRLDLLTEEWDG